MCVSILSKCNGSLVHAVHACMHRWPLVMSRPHTRGVPQVCRLRLWWGRLSAPDMPNMLRLWNDKRMGCGICMQCIYRWSLHPWELYVWWWNILVVICMVERIYSYLPIMRVCISAYTHTTLTQAHTETYNTHTRTHNMCTHTCTHNTCTSTYVHTTVVYLASTPSTCRCYSCCAHLYC